MDSQKFGDEGKFYAARQNYGNSQSRAHAVELKELLDLYDADAQLDKLRGAMNSFPPAYLVAAEVKFRLNQIDQAEVFARKFIAQAGDQPRAYQILGAIALKRGNLEAGIADLERAAKLAPDSICSSRLTTFAPDRHRSTCFWASTVRNQPCREPRPI